MRVIVCGGRHYADEARVFATLDALHAAQPITMLAHGGASGADRLAGCWADARRVPCEVFPANWAKHGRAAGPKRNRAMLAARRTDLVIAFPGGRGTADMVSVARAAGVDVSEVSAAAPAPEGRADG